MANETPAFVTIPFSEMESKFYQILTTVGFNSTDAKQTAYVFALNSLEGVYSHGVNRFPRFIEYIREGYVKVDGLPSLVKSLGSIEQWNGNLGPGVLNAIKSTDRAMELASSHGMGCVALANTNHWMRGGYYGWQAAKKGFAFIGWTNTSANMPAWGGVDGKLGNNPLVIAMPFENETIIIDTAMSQFSYGSLDMYRSKKEKLPVQGGYDTKGELSTDPEEIRKTARMLPIGYWKGSGLSLLLDIMATVLSGGLSTSVISKLGTEHSLSQIFFAFDLSKLNNSSSISKTLHQIIDDLHASKPEAGGPGVRYPGERVPRVREENTKNGIPVLKKIWEQVIAL